MPTCIICLDDTETIQLTQKQCECKPAIHTMCYNKWNTDSGGKCPICLKVSSTAIQTPTYFCDDLPLSRRTYFGYIGLILVICILIILMIILRK